jgi:hypothetical protein
MSILGKFNNVFYTPRFSIFEVLCIVLIGAAVAEFGPWWYLLLLPTSLFSSRMERLLEKDNE